MSKFMYPRLSRSEIVKVLADAQILAISDHDLLRPNSDFVFDLYTRILIYTDFINEDDNEQLEFSALDMLENPELHLDSVGIIKLYNHIKDALNSIDCPKRFILTDLIKPDSERTEFFISALLNFFLHKEGKMQLISAGVNELTLLDDQRKEWEEKISLLEREMEAIEESRERELPLVQEADAKVKELHQTISSLNNQQASLRVALRKLKEKNGELDEKISSAEFALVQVVQENANLRSKIVQSPEKLQKALEEKKLVREEARNAENLAMQAFQEKTVIVDVYTKVMKKVTKHASKMKEIQELVNSGKSVDKDCKALKTKLSDDEAVLKSLEAKLLERKKKAEHLELLKRDLEKEKEIKREEATESLHQVKLGVESRWQELNARQKNVNDVLAEVGTIASRIMTEEESAAAEQHMLLSRCEVIVKEFHEYKKSLPIM